MPTLVQEFDAMARDFAALMHNGPGPSDRRVARGQERSGPRQRVEASYLEPLRPSDLIRSRSSAKSSTRKTAPFASKRPPIGRQRFRIPAEFFMAALSKPRTALEGLLKKIDFSFRTIASLMGVALIIAAALFAWLSN